jgi:hypothetical protein
MLQQGNGLQGLAINWRRSKTVLLRRLGLEAHLLPDGDNGIADLVDGALQLASCHAKMFEPATNFGFVLHGDMAAVALALAGQNIAHRSSHPGLKQQFRAMGESLARQRPIDFRVSFWAGRQLLGIATTEVRQICPVDIGNIDIVGKHHGAFLSDA